MDTSEILALAGVIGAIIIVVIQQMYPSLPKYIGWPIVGLLVIISILMISPSHISMGWEIIIILVIVSITGGLAVYYGREGKKDINSKIKSDISTNLHTQREKAQHIHKNIMELFVLMEDTKNELSNKDNWLQNTKIIDLLSKLQTELNNLGYLINKSEYDRWIEAVMVHQSKCCSFI
jgi:hypothetical protein